MKAHIAFMRVLFGFLPVAVMTWHMRVFNVRQMRDVGHFMTMGLVATSFYFFAITRGTALLSSGLTAVLGNANMLFTALLSLFFLYYCLVNELGAVVASSATYLAPAVACCPESLSTGKGSRSYRALQRIVFPPRQAGLLTAA